MEVWIAIDEFPKYQVSNLARIRNSKGQILKLRLNSKGYYETRLYYGNGKSRNIQIHRIVAKHFVDNPNNYSVVNHIDGDKSNSISSNLEWCDISRNVNHSYYTLNNGNMQEVKIILLKTNEELTFKTVMEASRSLNVSDSYLHQIASGKKISKKYKVIKVT